MRHLKGRTAVVTGAGSGLGQATSIELARAGCDLGLVDLSEERLRETEKGILGLGRRCTLHPVDVSDREAVRALPDRVVAAHGAVHILVNNAGVATFGTFESHSIEDLEWVMGVNLWGVIYGCKFFLPHLLAREEAHIVNVSSMAAFMGLPKQSPYCVTKAAIRALGQSLGAELSGTRVGITTVLPGAIETRIVEGARASDAEKARVKKLMRRAASPETAAARIVGAIRRDSGELVIGPDAHVMHWTSRLFPGGMQWALARGHHSEGGNAGH